MPSLCDIDLPSLQTALTDAGLRPCHAMTILRQFMETGDISGLDPRIVGNGVFHFLQKHLSSPRSKILEKVVSSDGTTKLLIGFPTGGAVESVLMTGFKEGTAAGCVSSQIGCAMGCDFCASTRAGLDRNLTAGEIVEQFLHLKLNAGLLGRRLKNACFHGHG